jgi:uncharacterized membrane protein YhaH (DUF805 family)
MARVSAMTSPFSFQGQIGRLPYALWSIGIFLSQYLVMLIFYWAYAPDLPAPFSQMSTYRFYITPQWGMGVLIAFGRASNVISILTLGYLLIVAWALAALSFRRATNANISEWIAAAAIAPIVQIPVILALCLAPPRVAEDGLPRDIRDVPFTEWRTAAQGLIAGLGLTVASVAVGVLVFGTYGYGMFVVSPLVIGAVTAWLGNRRRDIGPSETLTLITGATALGGLALVGFALEGIVCIVLAAPLGFIMAWLGGGLGRAIARLGRRTPQQTLPGVAVLPMVFAVEAVIAATTTFDTTETIAVNAPPDRVWNAIVNMDPLDEPPGLPFRLGIAYPLRGEIVGEGVGALRRGEFSTGTAIERITEWVPERKLAFVVVIDIPGMREISPYQHVHAPHVAGYFLTNGTSFELLPLPDDRTEIIERTSHTLKLDPVFYWLPMARYVVHANNERVLAHIKRQSERDVRASIDQDSFRRDSIHDDSIKQ